MGRMQQLLVLGWGTSEVRKRHRSRSQKKLTQFFPKDSKTAALDGKLHQKRCERDVLRP